MAQDSIARTPRTDDQAAHDRLVRRAAMMDKAGKAVIYFLLALGAIIMITPLVWMLSTASLER